MTNTSKSRTRRMHPISPNLEVLRELAHAAHGITVHRFLIERPSIWKHYASPSSSDWLTIKRANTDLALQHAPNRRFSAACAKCTIPFPSNQFDHEVLFDMARRTFIGAGFLHPPSHFACNVCQLSLPTRSSGLLRATCVQEANCFCGPGHGSFPYTRPS